MKSVRFFSLSTKLPVFAMTATVFLSGCTPKNEKPSFTENDVKTFHKTMQRAQVSSKAEITQAMDLLYKGDYKEASLLLNRAIMDDPKNSVLHYLNGLAYHLRGERGEGDYHGLATQGYLTALRIDPTNWQASKQIGRLMLKQGHPKHAQEAFAEALLYNPDSASAFHDMAVASYYAHDVPRAYRYALMAVQKEPNNPLMVRTAALISASANEKGNAEKYLNEYKKHEKDTSEIKFLERRIADWNEFYRSGRFERAIENHKKAVALKKRKKQKARLEAIRAERQRNAALNTQGAQITNAAYLTNLSDTSAANNYDSGNSSSMADESSSKTTTASETASAPAAAASTTTTTTTTTTSTPPELTPLQKAVEASSKLKEPPIGSGDEMIILDGVVMRVSEEGTTAKGNNILTNLTAIATFANQKEYDITTPGSTVDKHYRSWGLFSNYSGATVGLTSPLIYGLQLANAQRQYVEVIGRPTLAVRMGKKGEFYSGDDRWLALNGQYGGNVEKIPIGIELIVTPVKIDDKGVITLEIEFKGQSVLSSPPAGQVTGNYLIIADSHVKTEVQARVGETLVLGGIKLKDDTQTKSGFPFLQNVPGLQYFFSSETIDTLRRNIVYMLTVRGYGKDMKSINEAFKKQKFKQVAVSELDERYEHWFKASSNSLEILRALQAVYREFRTGDLTPAAWSIWEKPSEILTETMAFLYY